MTTDMKRYFFILLAAFLAAVSCGKEVISDPVPGPTPVPDPSDDYEYVKVILPEDASFAWQTDDALTVVGDVSEEYSIVPGFTAREAFFRGKPVSGSAFTILFGEQESFAKAESHSYADQHQKASGNTEHLRPVIALSGVSDISSLEFSKAWAVENGAEFHCSGVLKFNVNVPAGVRILSSFSVKSSRPVLYATNASSGAADSLAVLFPDIDVSASGMALRAYMLTGWQDVDFLDSDKFTLTLNSQGRTVSKEVALTAGKFEAGTAYEVTTDRKGWKGNATTEGSEGNPFKIASVEDMLAMKGHMVEDNLDGPVYFIMTADVDMKDVDWTPLVTSNSCWPIDFNGDGHVISNLTVSGDVNFPSFVGVLDGSVHDVIFDKPSINCTKASADRVAVVSAWAGRSTGDITAEITNVEVRDASVKVQGAYASPTGILAGQANCASFLDCKVSGTVTAAGAAAECNIAGVIGEIDGNCSVSGISSEVDVTVSSASRVIGGCIGSVRQACTIEKLSHKGTLTITGGGDYSGLLIGHIAGKSVIRDCSVEGTFNGGGKDSGGLVGSFFSGAAGSLVETCTAKVTMVATNSDYHGGLVGAFAQANVNNMTIRNCDVDFELSLDGTKGNIGGILGANWNSATGSVIEGCSAKVRLATASSGNGGSIIGGIIGYTQTIIVRNCRAEGEITQCNYGIGGICGTVYTGSTVSNCFSKVALTARHGVGGIAGRADSNANASDATTTYDDTFEGCIAWNDKISSRMGIGSGNISAGAIVGKSVACNVHRNCWRKADLAFDCYSDAQYDALFDMPDNDKTTALSFASSTADPQSLGQYYWPYHGKAAAGGASASSVARTAGWDETVWDLSGSEPVLKR